MSLEPGQVIEGKYRILRLLGEGGMGAVYEGENVAIQRRVAIKILHSAVASNGDAVSRFEKEAQAAGKIGSDHITEVLDLGTLPNGDRFMVMEYLDGVTLSKRIQDRTRLTAAEAAPIVVQLLEGLGAAHEAGIIHRDLKPDNVFLLKSKAGRKDFVKVLDFGISKFNQLSGDSAMSMTRTGAVMGTPYYMSPEQAKGSKDITAQSDLYSVGVILYEAITGQVPFNADTFNELIFKIVLEAPPPPENFAPELDPGFSALIKKAMAREKEQRFQSALEFQQALVQWMQTGNVPLFEESGTTIGRPTGYGSVPGATPAPWTGTASQDDAPRIPTKGNGGLIAGIAIAGLLIVGGGGFLAMKALGGEKHASADPTPAAASSSPETPASADAAQTKAPTTSAEPATPPTPTASDDPEKDKDGKKPGQKTGQKTAGNAPPDATKPPDVTRPDPPKPPPTTPPANTGRKIRTSLD